VFQKEYQEVSPCSCTTLPQIRLEPILNDEHGGRIHTAYTIMLRSLMSRGAGSCSAYCPKSGKTPEKFRAGYCIAAGLTENLGIGWEGERDIVSAHLRVSISRHHPDIRNFITWFSDLDPGGSIETGYLYHLRPYPMSTDTEEWLFACALNPNDQSGLTRRPC